MTNVQNDAVVRRRRRRWPLVALAGALLGGAGTIALASTSRSADAASLTSAGWTTNATASPASVGRGQSVSLTVTVTSTATRQGLVDLEIYNPSGAKVFQKAWDAQSFTAGTQRSFTTSWAVPAGEALNTHAVRLGIFSPGWAQLYHWNANGAAFAVTAASGTTTTTRAPATTTTTRAPATTTTTTAGGSGHFSTLPPGSALPSDATCASKVRKTPEVRPENATYNKTLGHGAPGANPPYALYNRVTGNFTGTTDEIIQWAACKWGIDEDIVRAQTAKESWWKQSAVGDNGESFGLMQVRQPYWGWAFNNGVGDATSSSAYNMDAALAARRACFEGLDTWLGGSYAKGDLWGCVGLWFSGQWYDAGANTYIAAVKDYLNQHIWTTTGFLAG